MLSAAAAMLGGCTNPNEWPRYVGVFPRNFRLAAIVVGNSAYEFMDRLPNASADALLLTAALRQCGAYATTLLNYNRDRTLREIEAFGEDMAHADVIAFAFAGHGLTIDGHSYLMPIEAEAHTRASARRTGIPFRDIDEVLARRSSAQIYILDCCRTAPFNSMPPDGTRGITRGITPTPSKSSHGTLIVYSASPGQVALDGEGRHSPFAEALARNIVRKDVDAEHMFREVRNEVHEATRGRQTPHSSSTIIGRPLILHPT